MPSPDIIILQTKKWIAGVVVGCNFCPFAAKEMRRETIHYEVLPSIKRDAVLAALSGLFTKLDEDPQIETTLLILPGFGAFSNFLELADIAEAFLAAEKYEGIYQIASFHPAYLFAGSTNDDPANYTNRSPYPMLQLLREESLSRAIDSFPGVDDIPGNNIAFATKKGLAYMQSLREACMNDPRV